MNQADIDLIHGHIKAYEEKRLSVEEFTVLIAQIAEDNFEELEELLPQVEVVLRPSTWMVERAVATFDELVDTELRTDPLITPQNKKRVR